MESIGKSLIKHLSLVNLNYRELNDNQLTGLVPPELGKLTHLFDLNIGNNNLEGPTPDNLSSYLVAIDLVFIGFRNLHGNKLNETIPTALQRLESMTYLNNGSFDGFREDGRWCHDLCIKKDLLTLILVTHHLIYIFNFLGTSHPTPFEVPFRLMLLMRSFEQSTLRPNSFGTWSASELVFAVSSTCKVSTTNKILGGEWKHNNLSGDVLSLMNCLSLAFLNVSYNNLAGYIPTQVITSLGFRQTASLEITTFVDTGLVLPVSSLTQQKELICSWLALFNLGAISPSPDLLLPLFFLHSLASSNFHTFQMKLDLVLESLKFAQTMGILGRLMVIILVVAAPSVHGGQTYSVDWTLGTDYSSWATKAIDIGDTIVFNYDSSSHNVVVVDQSDYNNCVSSNAIQSYSNGKTSIALSKSGPMYFICGYPGHCTEGMQLQINVQASSSSSGSGTSPPATTSTPASSTPSSQTSPTTSTQSNGAAYGSTNMNGVVFGLSPVLGIVFAYMG
ncbi:hypothetical protein Dimus_005756 [Dionaea muscipula]